MIERLLALQEAVRPLINRGRASASEIVRDVALAGEIRALYLHYFGRTITGCKNCMMDALIELCTISKKIAMERTEKFSVKRGKVLKDVVSHDVRKNLVAGNETEELALYHIYTNPASKAFFDRLPDDKTLAGMLAAFGEKFEADRGAKNGVSTGVSAADKVINDANDKADEIVKDAEKRAKEIIAKANKDADKIIRKAKKSEKEDTPDPEPTETEVNTETEPTELIELIEE